MDKREKKTPLMELYKMLTKSQSPKMDNSHQLDVASAKRLVLEVHRRQKTMLRDFAEYMIMFGEGKSIDDCVDAFWVSNAEISIKSN